MAGTSWDELAKDVVDHKVSVSDGYREANAEMIREAVSGHGPHSTSRKTGGVRVVFNMSTAHIPAFVWRSDDNAAAAKAYMNRYDLAAAKRALGYPPPKHSLRQRIDEAVVEAAWPMRLKPEDIYYGAVELNGTGIRYFGDACLVLKNDAIGADQPVLYRNSYDLSTKPEVTSIYVAGDAAVTHKNAVERLTDWLGTWSKSVSYMAVCKVMEGRPAAQRRLTTATISQGILHDEDYIEIPKENSFNSKDVEECRLSSSDAAAEGNISDRITYGPFPTAAELQWRHRRRVAEHSLQTGKTPISVRVVTTNGRDRG